MNLQLQSQCFLLPKEGCKSHECEDAIGSRTTLHRFCVADGATEGFDSRTWARLLSKSWVRSSRPLLTREEIACWIEGAAQRWERRWTHRSLPWYAEEKAREGAYATFLGINFFCSNQALTWQAIALGDTCLFHWHRSVVQSFPLSNATEFGYRPALFPSNVSKQEAALDILAIQSGYAAEGDVFFLLSDAMAAWYMKAIDADPDGVREFDLLVASTNYSELVAKISNYRSDGSLRNDDVAIVRVEVVSGPPLSKGH